MTRETLVKHIPALLLILTAILGVATPTSSTLSASAGDQAVIDHIKKLENDRIQAGVRKDVAWVAAATADEYVQIDWEGKVLDKKAMLARIGSSNIQLQIEHRG